MILIEKALPCLLHLENRSSEAMIGRLLRRGFDLREGDKEATEALQLAIEKIMNESIFGQVDCPSNWQLPKKDDGTMGAIKLANWRARRMVEHIDDIIEVCLIAEEEKKCVEGCIPSLPFDYQGLYFTLLLHDSYSFVVYLIFFSLLL